MQLYATLVLVFKNISIFLIDTIQPRQYMFFFDYFLIILNQFFEYQINENENIKIISEFLNIMFKYIIKEMNDIG